MGNNQRHAAASTQGTGAATSLVVGQPDSAPPNWALHHATQIDICQSKKVVAKKIREYKFLGEFYL